jgi:hypothetical protein
MDTPTALDLNRLVRRTRNPARKAYAALWAAHHIDGAPEPVRNYEILGLLAHQAVEMEVAAIVTAVRV